MFPHAKLVTPNLDEARVLLGGGAIDTPAAMHTGGDRVVCAFTAWRLLIKGGHLDGSDDALDLLCLPGGAVHEFHAPFTARRFDARGPAARIRRRSRRAWRYGLALPAAVAQAKRYVTATINQTRYYWPNMARTASTPSTIGPTRQSHEQP